MSTAFKTELVSIASTRGTNENSPRERRAVRENRAKAMFSQALTYLGVLGKEAREALAAGKTIEVFGKHISQAEPGIARCVLCSGVHDLKSPELSKKITFFKDKDGGIVTLSQTCREDYFNPYGAGKLTNPAVYRGDFPKAPVKA